MSNHPRSLPAWFLMASGPRTVVTYCHGSHQEITIRLNQANDIEFESCQPVRPIPERVGQLNTPGQYWSATTARLVHYESFLESKWITVLDFDPDISAFSCQPMRFDGVDSEGVWWHIPDIFVRRAFDRPLLVDIKSPNLLSLNEFDVIRQLGRTRAAAASLGWEYAFVGEPDRQLWANLRWLAGFRRPPCAGHEYVAVLLDATQHPIEIGELCRACDGGEIARPVLFHLMWKQDITFDIQQPLRQSTLVWARGDRPPIHLDLSEADIQPGNEVERAP